MGGRGGLALALLIWGAMTGLAIARGSYVPESANTFGFVLSGPVGGRYGLVTAGVGAAATLLTMLMLTAMNRRFNFMMSASLLPASAFMLMAGACTGVDMQARGQLLALACVCALWLIFGRYGRRDKGSPAAIFIMSTIFSTGSAVNYVFLPMAVAFAAAAALLKAFGWREFGAWLIGLIAPWWTAIGLGLISIEQLHIPAPSALWMSTAPPSELIPAVAVLAVTAFWWLLATFRNSLTVLYSAGTTARAFSRAVHMAGGALLALTLIDWGNFTVYYVPLALFAAIEAGYWGAGDRRGASPAIYWLIAAGYAAIYITQLF